MGLPYRAIPAFTDPLGDPSVDVEGLVTGWRRRTAFLGEQSPSGKRCAFVRNHLWVSAYHPQERYPAGDYLHQCDGSDGIAAYVEKDRPIENADIVAWHVFGMHHLPRPEDFPVQPCIACGFRLMPCGFFDTNPCLGLPAARNRASCHTTSAREA